MTRQHHCDIIKFYPRQWNDMNHAHFMPKHRNKLPIQSWKGSQQ